MKREVGYLRSISEKFSSNSISMFLVQARLLAEIDAGATTPLAESEDIETTSSLFFFKKKEEKLTMDRTESQVHQFTPPLQEL